MKENGQKTEPGSEPGTDGKSCRQEAEFDHVRADAKSWVTYIKRLAVVYPVAAVFQDYTPNDQPETAVRDASSGET